MVITNKQDFRDRALTFLKRFAEVNKIVRVEEAREWAYKHGLGEPLDHRWWGAVTIKAKHDGIIKNVGKVPAHRNDGTLRSVWESQIYRL